jgi:hypothetical protein
MFDINKPVTNPELIDAINELQNEPNSDNEKVFIDMLVKANFIVPVEGEMAHGEPDYNGSVTLEKETKIDLPMLCDELKNLWHIAFTDWPSLYKWRKIIDEKVLVLPFSDFPALILHENVNSSGFIINPCSHNLPVSRQLLAHLSGCSNPIKIKESIQVKIGEPADYPHLLADGITALLKTMREVKKAWILLMQREGEQSFLIVVDFNGDKQKIFDAIGKSAASNLKPNQFVDMVSFKDDFGSNAVKNYKPFYEAE